MTQLALLDTDLLPSPLELGDGRRAPDNRPSFQFVCVYCWLGACLTPVRTDDEGWTYHAESRRKKKEAWRCAVERAHFAKKNEVAKNSKKTTKLFRISKKVANKWLKKSRFAKKQITKSHFRDRFVEKHTRTAPEHA